MNKRQSIYRTQDSELLGYIVKKGGVWQALTIFGVSFFEGSQEEAERMVYDKGLTILTDSWEYFDRDSSEWCRCIIVEASENYVKIAPISEYYPDLTKAFVLRDDLAQKLRKA